MSVLNMKQQMQGYSTSDVYYKYNATPQEKNQNKYRKCTKCKKQFIENELIITKPNKHHRHWHKKCWEKMLL